jgi:hypothetical protein
MPYKDKNKRIQYAKEYRIKTQCDKKRYWNNRDEERKRHKKLYRDNLDKRLAYAIKYRRITKNKVIGAYGGECAICGEKHFECLIIDHSNGDGGVFRKSVSKYCGSGVGFYRWTIKNNYPKDIGLRILCWNCNCSIGLYGYSPYEKKV